MLNAVEPTSRVQIVRDVAYGSDPRQMLDVYAPRPPRPKAPIVVFFYGGSWDSGRRQDYRFVGAALASRGFVAVIPDYRVYPQVRWPAFLQDSALAVRWARDHGGAYGGDPARLVLAGHSAGAYNAAMLTLDPRWLGAVGMSPARDVRAMAGLAGPYDFLPLKSERLKTIFGPPGQRPDTQPINHLGEAIAPLWLGTDLHDRYVDPGNTRRLAAAAKARGARVETRTYPRLNHELMIGVFATPLGWLAPVFRDLTRFIDAETR
jgi:acetyl esterase/lipase